MATLPPKTASSFVGSVFCSRNFGLDKGRKNESVAGSQETGKASSRHSSKQFVVECKRLGKAVRADWVLNVNYVQHGIMRFKLPEWAYAKRFPTGAMVGYLQSMEPHDVLGEVNEESSRNALPALVLDGMWNPGSVSRCAHVLDRTFEVSPFTLHHLWIDLRPQKGE